MNSGGPPESEMAVVIIAVGAPPELATAVRSILDQDTPTEVVVVNSGGGDVRARLGADADAVAIRSHDDLLWPGAARNRGIEATRAPFVAFLAADCVAAPGWVAQRLKRHNDGDPAVASAVVNDAPGSLIAWASHVTLFARRLPGIPTDKTLRYGASYERGLFVKYGLFREDLRIGEDTEFHMRFARSDIPSWAPEILTLHTNRTTLAGALADQYTRGKRAGRYWPLAHRGRIHIRIRRRFLGIFSILRELDHGAGWRLYAGLPLVALNVAAFELGVRNGCRHPCAIARQEGLARKAAKGKRWERSHDHWMNSENLSPGRAAPLLGRGQALLKLGRFDEATAVFTAVLEKSPGQLAALTGRGKALIDLGRLDEARAALSEAHDAFPDDPVCLRLMARVAELQNDWPAALACYRMLRETPEDTDAPFRAVRLLITLRRFGEAEAIVEQIRETGFEHVYLRCALVLLESLHDWDALARTCREHEELVLTRTELISIYVNGLCVMGRFDEALAAIGKSPAGKKPFRDRLEAITLVRAGRHDEAWRRFDETLREGTIADLPSALTSAVTVSAFEHRGAGFAGEILDQIESRAPDSKAGAAMRFAVPFHRARLSCLSGIRAGRPFVAPIDPPEHLLSALADREPADRNRPIAQEDIAALCETFSALRGSRRGFFPDPAFVLSDALAVTGILLDAFEEGRPLSLVRLGDGEGNFLPYRSPVRQLRISDQARTLRTWWGGDLPDQRQIADFERELTLAIEEADVAGIPDLFRFSKTVAGEGMLANSAAGKTHRGLLAALDFVNRENRDHQVLTSCHIHQALAFWGLWDLLLPRFGTVSLVTCHGELAPSLGSRYGITIAEVFLIPSERKYASVFGHADNERHYPEVFESLRSRLADIEPGRVCLVAAGALGKIYCHWIRRAGGIAIDVGSAADYWSGYSTTRGVEEINYYRSPDSLTEAYRRLSGTEPLIARLLGSATRKRYAI